MGDWWDALEDAYDDVRGKIRKYTRPAEGSGSSVNRYYEDKLKTKHGSERYYWENVPFFSWVHKLTAGAKKAQDEYDRTGKDDVYGDRYTGAVDSFVNQISGTVAKARRMAKTLDGMYPAEVEEDLSWEKWSKYDPYTERMHEYGITHKTRHKR